MPKTPESRLRDAIKVHLEALQKSGCRVKYLKIHGGPMMESGTPDFLVVLDGRAYFIEVKVSPNKPTPLQLKRLEEWRTSGARVGVVYSLDDVAKVLFGNGADNATTPR